MSKAPITLPEREVIGVRVHCTFCQGTGQQSICQATMVSMWIHVWRAKPNDGKCIYCEGTGRRLVPLSYMLAQQQNAMETNFLHPFHTLAAGVAW